MELFWMLLITVVILQVSVLWTTIYLHRTLAHRGVEMHPAAAVVMHLHLALFTGINPRQWVAVHRKHHRYSDEEGDPHSPYLFGLWHVFFGNAIYYRREARNPETVRKFTPDIQDTLIDKLPGHSWLFVAGAGIFVAMFGWAWGLGLWVFHDVAYILLNSSINSLCHMVGYRNFDNKATNIQAIALLTGGEGLHNNHHESPTSALFAMKRGEFDPAWPVIRLLETVGLAHVKRLPAAKAA